MLRESLLMYAVRRGGLRRAVRAVGVLTAWTVWLDSHYGPPSAFVLSGETERSRASWYRDLAAFQVCFPGESDPTRLASAILEVHSREPWGLVDVADPVGLDLTIVGIGQLSSEGLGLVA